VGRSWDQASCWRSVRTREAERHGFSGALLLFITNLVTIALEKRFGKPVELTLVRKEVGARSGAAERAQLSPARNREDAAARARPLEGASIATDRASEARSSQTEQDWTIESIPPAATLPDGFASPDERGIIVERREECGERRAQWGGLTTE
jgi:hypothetical protein